MERIFLSRRNLLSLLSKLDRKAKGEHTSCEIIKKQDTENVYTQTMAECAVVAVPDEEFYAAREPGTVHPSDDPASRDLFSNAVLAHIIRSGREQVNRDTAEPHRAAHLHSLRYVAEQFAARANVDKEQFLKVCGLD